MNRTFRSVAVLWSLFLGNFLLARCMVLQDMGCGLCFQSVGTKGWLFIAIFFMWLRSLQWPVLSRNIMVCLWRDCKRWVPCWGLLPPFLCLKSVRLLLAKCNEMRRLGPNIYGLKSGPDLLSSILTCGTLPRRCWTISKIDLSLTRK